MSDLILKQIRGDDSNICAVPTGCTVHHRKADNEVVIMRDQEAVVRFDLADGIIYLMNAAGKTVDKYNSNGNVPKAQAVEGFANKGDHIFSMGGIRYINVNSITYRIPADLPITLIGLDVDGKEVGKVGVSRWITLNACSQLGDLFRAKLHLVDKIKVVGQLDDIDFNLSKGNKELLRDAPLAHEEMIKEFGVNFVLSPGIALTKGIHHFSADEAGRIHYHGMKVEGL